MFGTAGGQDTYVSNAAPHLITLGFIQTVIWIPSPLRVEGLHDGILQSRFLAGVEFNNAAKP
jgi:hypothetical protein